VARKAPTEAYRSPHDEPLEHAYKVPTYWKIPPVSRLLDFLLGNGPPARPAMRRDPLGRHEYLGI
jgi:hypothetical protein